ncbi:MAG: AAA family ATPase [Phycisphaeraceae bacterium]
MVSSVRIRRLHLRNFKSVEHGVIEFTPLTLLVGRNGVGKSNIVDALRFLSDALGSTLEYAIRERGGIDEVRRKSLGGRPTNPGLAVDLETDQWSASYGFRIAAVEGRSFRVDHEVCEVRSSSGQRRAYFEIRKGKQKAWSLDSAQPAVVSDRLYLVAASGSPEFFPVFDILTRMTFHNLNPQVMRSPVRPEPGERLSHDGGNLPSVIKKLQSQSPEQLDRVVHYLRAIGVPVTRISHKPAGSLETIEVAQETPVPQGRRNSNFDAIALSDGTLRALGILVSLVSGRSDRSGPSLVAIEEPETALHPAAVGALVDALLEGADVTQTLVTCHSPDLLDHPAVTGEMIRVVLLDGGKTVIGPLDDQKQQILQDHLFSAGELLRLDQLTPDEKRIREQQAAAGTLFEAIV